MGTHNTYSGPLMPAASTADVNLQKYRNENQALNTYLEGSVEKFFERRRLYRYFVLQVGPKSDEADYLKKQPVYVMFSYLIHVLNGKVKLLQASISTKRPSLHQKTTKSQEALIKFNKKGEQIMLILRTNCARPCQVVTSFTTCIVRG